MTVDLKWHDAIASAKWAFDAVERVAGWPESMAPHQLAALQRPWVPGDVTSKRRLEALFHGIWQACADGELTNEQRVITAHRDEPRPIMRNRHTSIGDMWEPGTEHVQVPYQVQIHYVTAAAFADWLRTQGEEPSQYIAHWFKVRGVAAPAVLQLTQPAVDDAAKPDDTAPAIPTTWAELVVWTGRKAPGFRWTDDLRLILATEKKRRTDLRHTGIAQAMGNELGCTGKNVNTLIAEMGKPGSREQMLGRAIASVSNGTNGKSGR